MRIKQIYQTEHLILFQKVTSILGISKMYILEKNGLFLGNQSLSEKKTKIMNFQIYKKLLVKQTFILTQQEERKFGEDVNGY